MSDTAAGLGRAIGNDSCLQPNNSEPVSGDKVGGEVHLFLQNRRKCLFYPRGSENCHDEWRSSEPTEIHSVSEHRKDQQVTAAKRKLLLGLSDSWRGRLSQAELGFSFCAVDTELCYSKCINQISRKMIDSLNDASKTNLRYFCREKDK